MKKLFCPICQEEQFFIFDIEENNYYCLECGVYENV